MKTARGLTTPLAILVAALAAPPAQAVSSCKPDEIGVLVCPQGDSELRAIRNTLSPHKAYVVAWATDKGKTGKDYELLTHEDYKARFADEDVPLFLVRVSDGTVVTKLNATHLGDQARYNHKTLRAVWSRNERWVTVVNDGKWITDGAETYHLGANGVSQPLDLRKVCVDAEHRYFTRTPLKGSFDKYAQSMDVKSIGDDGSVAAICTMQVIKQDDIYNFAIRAKLTASGKDIGATIGSVTLCKDDDQRPDCAFSDVPD